MKKRFPYSITPVLTEPHVLTFLIFHAAVPITAFLTVYRPRQAAKKQRSGGDDEDEEEEEEDKEDDAAKEKSSPEARKRRTRKAD